jgi:hypothetical protein
MLIAYRIKKAGIIGIIKVLDTSQYLRLANANQGLFLSGKRFYTLRMLDGKIKKE